MKWLVVAALLLSAVAVWQYRLWEKLPSLAAINWPTETPPPATNTHPTLRAVLTNAPATATNRITSPAKSALVNSTTNIARTNSLPLPSFKPSVFEAQLALARLGISSGSIDGTLGPQSRAAIRAFQVSEHLPPSGDLNEATKSRLPVVAPLHVPYTITTNDLARLQPISGTWLGKSQQTALDYENILELVAEKSWSAPAYIRRLNLDIVWTNVAAGTVVQVPNVAPPTVRGKAAFLKIFLEAKVLEAFDANTNLLAHFPCSIAQRVEKRPAGELHVVVAATNPNYTFDPEVFPESAEARQLKQKLILPPGPNNPVGVAWIGLDLPGYGIHGTPRPEDVGRTESHGCFRLANWNAEFLLKLVSVGTPVLVEP